MGWVGESPPLPPLPPWKTRYPFYRRLGGPQGRSGRAKILVPTGIQSPDRQAGAQSLYRLSYPAHQLSSKRCKLRLLLSQSCLLSTTFWQIHFPSTNSSIPSHLRLFALLQCARALQCQEGARLVPLQISFIWVVLLLFVLFCYLCCSVVIYVLLLLFVFFCSYLCCSAVIFVVLYLLRFSVFICVVL